MNNTKKLIGAIIGVIMFAALIAGATYAALSRTANTTNATQDVASLCFLIDYNINNTDGSQDITGTMFPSGTIAKGLNGRVGLKINSSCTLNGTGTLKLHINNTTSSALTTPAASYCENRSTLEKIDGITTEAACKADNVKGRWRGYGDSYCENPNTLERMPDYTTQSDCTSHSGTWKTGGSPLKYAVYNNANLTGNPISKGHITSSDIGKDITIYDNFPIDDIQQYYYIYIWLDGYQTDNTHTELPFSGYISASAIQTTTQKIYRYSTQMVQIGQTISSEPRQAWCGISTEFGSSCDFGMSWETQSECEAYNSEYNIENTTCEQGTVTPISYETNPTNLNKPFYLRHTIEDNVVTESYVGFIVTPEMASANQGMTAGTYYLKGGDGGTAYEQNKATLLSAFGNTYCTGNSSRFRCRVSGLGAGAHSNGIVNVNDGASARCYVNNNGNSRCNE